MRKFRDILVALPAVLFAVFLIGTFATRGVMQQLGFLRNGNGSSLVDQRPWQTAQALAPLAVSAEEQALAQEAERLAEHEVSQAFAYALRKASVQTRVLSGEALETQKRVTALEATLADDKARVDALTAAAAKSGIAPEEGDDLDVAKAQMGLDQDQLTDAMGDLQRESGDQRAKIEQELQAHEEAVKKYGSGMEEKGQVAVLASRRYGTLAGRMKAWFDQRSRVRSIAQAEDAARGDAAELSATHSRLESGTKRTQTTGMPPGLGGAARAKVLRSLAGQSAMMSLLDDRMQAETQLAAVYARWQQQVWTQHRIVFHLILQSLALVAFIVLLAVLLDRAGTLLIGRLVRMDVRRGHTLRTILHLAVEVIATIAVLLAVFGVPQQMPTILGLATAGLTVVFQDFILAFFGWFVLMGKHGIRVGDWVEIDSVGGEVAEIGLFRTALLETGNWTSQGHPTGRRVTFINSFAIRGQYFNFSTQGQWMWDEIKINLPAGSGSYAQIEKIDEAVRRETAANTEEAEREWQRATQKNGLSQFNATPTVDMRPAAVGVDVIVRYVTKAAERYEMANRLNQMLLGIMKQDG